VFRFFKPSYLNPLLYLSLNKLVIYKLPSVHYIEYNHGTLTLPAASVVIWATISNPTQLVLS